MAAFEQAATQAYYSKPRKEPKILRGCELHLDTQLESTFHTPSTNAGNCAEAGV